jgi:hypothetical protein
MAQNNSEEIDLIFFYKKFIEVLTKGVGLLFKALDYTIKKWKIILILLIAGVGLGIYSSYDSKPAKKASLIVRVNFEAVNYMYSSIDFLNAKIKDKDSVFLRNIGLTPDSLEVKKIEALPHVSIKDILDKYDIEDRRFEPILRNLDFNELFDDDTDALLDRTFIAEYKYHSLRFYLSSSATNETIGKILDYLNSNEFLSELKTTTLQNLESHLKNNNNVIDQIDTLLNTYYTNESLVTPNKEIYVVDKNFSVNSLLTQKVELQNENEEIKKELVYSKNIVVPINSTEIANEDMGITSNKIIFYPFVFIMIFLLISYVRYLYFTLRELTKNS